jgi:hypothetical protein
MSHTELELSPSAPDKALRAIIYEGGGLHLRSVGPRGGWYNVTVPASEVPKLAAFIGAALAAPSVEADEGLLTDA